MYSHKNIFLLIYCWSKKYQLYFYVISKSINIIFDVLLYIKFLSRYCFYLPQVSGITLMTHASPVDHQSFSKTQTHLDTISWNAFRLFRIDAFRFVYKTQLKGNGSNYFLAFFISVDWLINTGCLINFTSKNRCT